MPGVRSLGSRVSLSVSGAVPPVAASVSHAASGLCCAVHCGAAFRLALKIASADDRIVSPTGAVSTTRGGVTAITFDGGASKSDATLQRTEHGDAQAEGRELGEEAKDQTERTGGLGDGEDAEIAEHPRGHLRGRLRLPQMAFRQAVHEEDGAEGEAEQQERDVGEPVE